MKRIAVCLLALVYFAVSSGFTMHLHYCMGQFVDASFTDEGDAHTCTHCGMTKQKGDNGCCKDEHKVVKSSADHALTKQVHLSEALYAVLPSAVPACLPANISLPPAAAPSAFRAHAPPDPDPIPLFLKLRNLRI